MTLPYHRAARALRSAASVVMCAHVRPDGDAVGSVLALTLALRAAGVPAVPVLADSASRPPRTYSFLPGFALLASPADVEAPDVLVALDTPNVARLGDAGNLLSAAGEVVVMDHHPDNTEFGTINLVDPAMPSTSALVWRLLAPLEVPPSRDIALCCYVGLMTDTGRFAYDNTTPATLRDAAEMVEAGVDPAEASRLVYQERTLASLQLQSLAMARITLANDGRVAWTWIGDTDLTETGASPEETEYLPDAIRELGGVEVALLLHVHPDHVRGNLRAKTGFDVGSVARSIGGGGHRAAAGFEWTGSLDDLLTRLLPALPGGE